MPALVKYVMMFRSSAGYGWSETHYKNSASATPDLQSLLDAAMASGSIMLARRDLLGEDCVLHGLRVSYPRDGVVASQSRNVFLPGQNGEESSAPALSLAWGFFDSTRTRKKITHLRGFWDKVERDESYFPAGGIVNGWVGRLNAYRDALVGGNFGWPSKDAASSSKGVVSTYVVGLDGLVTFTVVTDGGAALAAGGLVTVRFSRINKSNSVLNRSILCTIVNPTTLRSVAPIAAGVFTSVGRYNLRRPAFVGYAGCSDPVLGERRMGAPLGHSPGRSKAKPRL